jgi:hypothetical protein
MSPKEPDLPKAEADPEHRTRGGSLSLADKIRKDKNLPKDYKFTEKELEEFRKAMAEKPGTQPGEKLAKTQGGNMRNIAHEVKPGEKNDTSNAKQTGQGKPPPEFRELFRQYTSGNKDRN